MACDMYDIYDVQQILIKGVERRRDVHNVASKHHSMIYSEAAAHLWFPPGSMPAAPAAVVALGPWYAWPECVRGTSQHTPLHYNL
jgi:hypothetical protein